jgi:hypothetical protein
MNPRLSSSLFSKTKQYRTTYSLLPKIHCQGLTFAGDFFPLVRTLSKYSLLFCRRGRISARQENRPCALALTQHCVLDTHRSLVVTYVNYQSTPIGSSSREKAPLSAHAPFLFNLWVRSPKLQSICSGWCAGIDKVDCRGQTHKLSSADQSTHLFISSFIHPLHSVNPRNAAARPFISANPILESSGLSCEGKLHVQLN